MEFIIISGLSGAGKSSIAGILEDIGFYCVDNLPVSFIPDFVSLCMTNEENGNYQKVAVVTDVRSGMSFSGLFHALLSLDNMQCPYKILFAEASDEIIIQRYKETRHAHPLAHHGYSLAEALAHERTALSPVRERATHYIDTSFLNHAKLRREVLSILGEESSMEVMPISVLSFGFKYGIAIEADLVFDVRFLPNPFYIPSLKEHTGLDQSIHTFLFSSKQTHAFISHLQSMLSFLLPQYIAEGKSNLTIAFGCTGGRHRSVAIAHHITNILHKQGYHANAIHRDISR